MDPDELSHVGQTLRAYGVGPDENGTMTRDRISIRQAAILCGVSKETLARQLRPKATTKNRKIRPDNLEKIARGLNIPTDLLEQQMGRDWGWTRMAAPGSVSEVLAQIMGFTRSDLSKLQLEIFLLSSTPAARRRARHTALNSS